MRTLRQPSRFSALPGPIVLAAGFFDGMHRGHQRVLAGALARARCCGGQAWVLTFDRHPLALLAPGKQPPLLMPLDVRLKQIAATGVDGCLVLPFTRALAALSPEAFVAMLCGRSRHVAAISCGANWRFGARAAGDPAELARLGRRYGFRVTVMRAATAGGRPISSTRIRRAIVAGHLHEAAVMLGRPYAIRGTVVRGRGVGRTLDMATANIQPDADVLPPLGIYAVRARIGRRTVDGVASFGFRPTFADARPEKPLLEVHLFDFVGDLYGATLDVAFIQRLRPERRYPSPDALMAQVKRDIAQARRVLASGDNMGA